MSPSVDQPEGESRGHRALTIEQMVQGVGEMAFAVEAREAVECAIRVIMDGLELDHGRAWEQLVRWAADHERGVVWMARVIARTHVLPDPDSAAS